MSSRVKSEEAPKELLQISGHGPVFELKEGWTVERVRNSAGYAAAHKKPWRCRIKHRLQKVGELYEPEDDLLLAICQLITHAESLHRCRRCGEIRQRNRPF